MNNVHLRSHGSMWQTHRMYQVLCTINIEHHLAACGRHTGCTRIGAATWNLPYYVRIFNPQNTAVVAHTPSFNLFTFIVSNYWPKTEYCLSRNHMLPICAVTMTWCANIYMEHCSVGFFSWPPIPIKSQQQGMNDWRPDVHIHGPDPRFSWKDLWSYLFATYSPVFR